MKVNKTIKIILSLFILTMFSGIGAAALPEPVVTVGPSGGADYQTDGTSDHVQINQALTYIDGQGGGTVLLEGSNVYDINETLSIGDNTVFTGGSNAVIRINNAARWRVMTPVVGQIDGLSSPTHDVEIYGLEFDCNAANLTHPGEYDETGTEYIWGKGFYNTIYIKGSTASAPDNYARNISIHDNYFHDGMGDSARMFQHVNYTYYNNVATNMQHATVYCAEVLDADIHDNHIEHITNAGIRVDNCEDINIYDNTLKDYTGPTSAWAGGSEGIQISDQSGISRLTDNIRIFDNDIQGAMDALQFMDLLETAGTTPQRVYVYNNNIHNSGSATVAEYNSAITIWNWGSGIEIYHNWITNNYAAGVLIYDALPGCEIDIWENNIIGIVDTEATSPLSVTGYGILNYIGDTYMEVNATNNYIADYSTGAYYGVDPVSTASEPLNWIPFSSDYSKFQEEAARSWVTISHFIQLVAIIISASLAVTTIRGKTSLDDAIKVGIGLLMLIVIVHLTTYISEYLGELFS